jgi:hypothetical protein
MCEFVNEYEIGEIRFDLTAGGDNPTRTQVAAFGSLFSRLAPWPLSYDNWKVCEVKGFRKPYVVAPMLAKSPVAA